MRSDLKKLWNILLLIMLMSSLTLAFTPVPTAVAGTETFENFGPRVDQILIKNYGTRDKEFSALVTGDIDIIDWPLDYGTYTTLLADPTHYVVDKLSMIDMYNLEMNCLKWPTSDVNFRRAIAHLWDKETFWQQQLKTFSGVILDSPIATEWTQWHNLAVTKYAYNPTLAGQILDAAGFVLKNPALPPDPVSNPRMDPSKSPIAPLDPLLFYIRSDDPDRMSWGQNYMMPAMLGVGIPVKPYISPKTVCWEAVMKYPYNYHLYTGGWGPYTDPDFLYDQYNYKFGWPYWVAHRDWANNYVFFNNTEFDYWSEQLKFAPNMASAVTPCMECQRILMDQVPMIPGWHSAGAVAYRSTYGHWTGEEKYWDQPWTGMVNVTQVSGMGTCGVNGWWTFLNCHTRDYERGGVIRYGFMNWADVLNPVQADFYWDWEALNKIYEFLITRDPYTGADLPWMAKSWKVETWNNAGNPATKVTFTLFPNILWHDGIPVTAYDVAFTLQYMKDAYSSLFYMLVLDLDHTKVIDKYTVEVYYGHQSCWALHMLATVPMIPEHIWAKIPPANSRSGGEYETTGHLTGSGPFKFVTAVQGQSITLVANPTYFRKLVQPDFVTEIGTPPNTQLVPGHNDLVDIDDFGMAIGHYGDYKPWTDTTWGPVADVNKDYIVDLDDIMEVGARYGQPAKYGYPPYYYP